MQKTSRLPGRRLPGDPPLSEQLHAMLRVDHAGEYGAMRIYAGQGAMLKDKEARAHIAHMAEQEQEHLNAFTALLAERKVRPTLLQPLWHAAGYAMGAVTALFGARAAMTCTAAVEDVIDRHYRDQIERLPPAEKALAATLESFRADEQAHHDLAMEEGARAHPLSAPLFALVGWCTRTAIALSSRW